MLDEADVLSRAAQRIGTMLHGKYRLDAVLGIGGMAVVYAATHRNQMQFAVKVLHAELSARSELRARFLREGYAANSVGHEGVVAVLDDDVDEAGTAFLVMDLLCGADVELLRSRWNGKLPLQLALEIAHQVLDVLSAAHRKGVVHRDLKPANFFALESGEVKVLDFGVAQLRAHAVHADVTRSGAVLGSPAFMAPEQAAARNSDVDARTDLWALGASLFTLLSGHFVHEAENGQQTLIRAATTPARSLASVAPELPLSVVELVDRALQLEPGARWDSAVAMGEAVDRAQRELFGERSLEPLRTCVEGFGAPRYRISARAASTTSASEPAGPSEVVEVSRDGDERPSGSTKPVAFEAPRPSWRGRRASVLAFGAAALAVTVLAHVITTSSARSATFAPPNTPLQVIRVAASPSSVTDAAPSAGPSPLRESVPADHGAYSPPSHATTPKAVLAKLVLGPSRARQPLGIGAAPALAPPAAPVPAASARSNPLELELQ